MTEGGVASGCGRGGGSGVGSDRGAVCLGVVPTAAFAGVVALGVADSAASAIGLRFGRHRIFSGPPPLPPSRCSLRQLRGLVHVPSVQSGMGQGSDRTRLALGSEFRTTHPLDLHCDQIVFMCLFRSACCDALRLISMTCQTALAAIQHRR